MFEYLKFALGIILAILIIWRLRIVFNRNLAEKREFHNNFYEKVKNTFDDYWLEQRTPHELPLLHGKYKGHDVQLRPVIDILATRKLPSLWLQVTFPKKLSSFTSTLDIMRRPAALNSFSNFDLLPHTLGQLPGLPSDALAKCDSLDNLPIIEKIKPAFRLLYQDHVKELLISPNGIRFVLHLSEGDRLRYGIFRQARFEHIDLNSEMLLPVLQEIEELQNDLNSGESVDEASAN